MKKVFAPLFISLLVILSLFCSRLRANTVEKVYYRDSISMIGVFGNGLKYYIQQNSTPKGGLVLKWVVKTGAFSEPKNQKGSAHFLEHMLFLGTEHFQKMSIIDTLEKSGMGFGRDFNAFTREYCTEYVFRIPRASDSLVKIVIQVIDDWVNHRALLDSVFFEKERKILLTETLGYHRYYMGLEDSRIPDLTREQLALFYRQYYTPNNMALIVVGDMALDTLQNLIRQTLTFNESKINQVNTIQPTSSRNKLSFLVESKDPKSIQIFYSLPFPYYENQGLAYAKERLYLQLSQHILDQRLCNQVGQSALYYDVLASFIIGNTPRAQLYILGRSYQEEGLDSLFVLLQTQVYQLVKYGVSEQELQKALKRQIRIDSLAYILKPNTPSEVLVNNYQSAFMQEDTIYGSVNKYKFDSIIFSQISTQGINHFIKKIYRKSMQSVCFSASEYIDSASKLKKIQKLYQQTSKKKILPYSNLIVDTTKREICILPYLPRINTLNSHWQVQDSVHEIYSTTLSNGIKATFKPNKGEKRLSISAVSTGGEMGGLPDSLFSPFYYQMKYQNLIGVGSQTRASLQENEEAKHVSFRYLSGMSSFYVEANSDSLYAETQFKLFYALFTQPAVLDTIELKRVQVLEITTNSDNAKNEFFHFYDTLRYIYSGGSESCQNFIKLPKHLEVIKDAQSIYFHFCESFTNPFPFHFYIVGDIEKDTLLSLLETYIGSLPSREEKQTHVLPKKKEGFIPTTSTDLTLEYENCSTSYVLTVLRNQIDLNFVERQSLEFFAYILKLRLRERLRNEMNVVYFSTASVSIIPYRDPIVELKLMFQCSPNLVDSLTPVSWAIFDSLLTKGPSEVELNKAKLFFLHKLQPKVSTNSFLLGNLEQINDSEDVARNLIWSMEEYLKVISQISCETLRQTAYKCFENKIYTRGKMVVARSEKK